MQVKICGLTRMEDIHMCNLCKPNYVGFVFAKSKRQISEEQAKQFRRELSEDILAVGVFVNAEKQTVARLLTEGVIDIAQLHGSEEESEIVWLKEQTAKPVWKAVTVRRREDIVQWEESAADMLVLDNGAGTGENFDWELLSSCNRKFFLAGGIRLSNIGNAILCKPYGIDVSSGVETDGKKDAIKVEKIIKRITRGTGG